MSGQHRTRLREGEDRREYALDTWVPLLVGVLYLIAAFGLPIFEWWEHHEIKGQPNSLAEMWNFYASWLAGD